MHDRLLSEKLPAHSAFQMQWRRQEVLGFAPHESCLQPLRGMLYLLLLTFTKS